MPKLLFTILGQLCNKDPACKNWGYTTANFNGEKNSCWLKNGRGRALVEKNIVSGMKGCPETNAGTGTGAGTGAGGGEIWYYVLTYMNSDYLKYSSR